MLNLVTKSDLLQIQSSCNTSQVGILSYEDLSPFIWRKYGIQVKKFNICWIIGDLLTPLYTAQSKKCHNVDLGVFLDYLIPIHPTHSSETAN